MIFKVVRLMEQKALYDKLVVMEEILREHPSESDPRWSNSPPDPILAATFLFIHEEPDPKHHPHISRIQMDMSGT